ncbi:MAG: NUDIX hydrolase [Pseudomonadota bacterium]
MSRAIPPAKPVVAVGVVCLRDNNVLLVRRAKPPRQGAWSLPGGHLEWGERAADAALRELSEETGVTARLLGLVDVVDVIYPAHHYVVLDYAAAWTAGDPVAADDALAAEFAPLDQLAPYDLSADTIAIIEAATQRFSA